MSSDYQEKLKRIVCTNTVLPPSHQFRLSPLTLPCLKLLLKCLVRRNFLFIIKLSSSLCVEKEKEKIIKGERFLGVTWVDGELDL